MTIRIEITAPIEPNTKSANKLTKVIKAALNNDNVEVRFFESRIDLYGHKNFDVLALDSARRELTDVRNTVVVALFNTFFQNGK
jgi:hypothetical protein